MAFMEDFQHLKIHLEDIKSATGNFDNGNVIGQGGFGKVYKGILPHSEGQNMVAFKRLDRRYGQGNAEFWKEIIMLSDYKHTNLISLLGFCDDDGEKILAYEYASNGSLDRHLSSTTLTWRERLKICLGAAMGLCYLHDPRDTQQRVIHRDIKSSNMLLDEYWNPKVSDMGLSKIGPANQKHTFVPTNVVGTLGYVDPLYVEMSILMKESDVYSFGVVLFEVLCGRLCFRNDNNGSLVQTWMQSYEQKILDEIIFQDLKQEMDLRSLEAFSDIAYRCLQKSSEKRPQMSQVVEQLEIALRFNFLEEPEPPVDCVVEISEEAELHRPLVPEEIPNGGETETETNNLEDRRWLSSYNAFFTISWKNAISRALLVLVIVSVLLVVRHAFSIFRLEQKLPGLKQKLPLLILDLLELYVALFVLIMGTCIFINL